jgi:hypothetical protein
MKFEEKERNLLARLLTKTGEEKQTTNRTKEKNEQKHSILGV